MSETSGVKSTVKSRKKCTTYDKPSEKRIPEESKPNVDTDRAEVLTGVTSSGHRFRCPTTSDSVTSLVYECDIPTALCWIGFIISTVAVLPVQLPHWAGGYPLLETVGVMKAAPREAILFIAVFWRLAYNLGLGMLLDAQSKDALITRWVERMRASNSLLYRLFRRMFKHTLREWDGDVKELPVEFEAWLLFRYLANVVLPNDVLAFVLMAFMYGNLSQDACTADVSCCCCCCVCVWLLTNIFVLCTGQSSTAMCWSLGMSSSLGIALIVSSIQGKRSAHHVLGQYAWFWGDFFFRLERSLSFDGIFQLFPHPMYTVTPPVPLYAAFVFY